MMIKIKTKYIIKYTNTFKKSYKRIKKQGRNINKLKKVIEKLSNNEILDKKYKNHNLINDKTYKNCKECHIEPDWLLVYQYNNEELILLLINTGSHSNLFNK